MSSQPPAQPHPQQGPPQPHQGPLHPPVPPTPQQPGVPQGPGVAQGPGVPPQGVPRHPDVPRHPGVPQGSGVPQQPGFPSHLGVPPRPTPTRSPNRTPPITDTEFVRVSPKLATVRLLGLGFWSLVWLIGVVALGIFVSWWFLLGLIALVVVDVWTAIVIVRQVKAIGYAVREADLLIRTGIMFHRITVVPYARMQFVDVTYGPVDRAFGLAKVQLHTASASTDAEIPGMPTAAAEDLRELLAARGRDHLAGL